MAAKTYGRTALTGGASGSLDEYDADNLNNGDRCMTVLSTGVYYIHRLDASSGAAESSPDVVKPDSGGGVSPYAGDKRWILSSTGSLVISDLTSSKPVFTNASKKLVSTGTLAVDQGGTGVTASTGTTAVVLSNSPTLVTPVLGTPASGDLSNCTAASDSATGVVELSTDDEAKTGESDAVVMTPGNVRAAVSGATTVAATYTSLITDSVIYGNHATTAFTITLLAAATAGANKRYTIANINAALVTVDGNSAETVGGLPKQCIGQNEAITIDCDGSNWHIVHDARVKSSVNQLTNSGFGVWSNSEDLYTTAGDAVGDATVEDATDLIDNGNMGNWNTAAAPDVPTGWTSSNAEDGEIFQSDVAGTPGAGGYMCIDASSNAEGTVTNLFTVEAGKLYEFTGSFTQISGNSLETYFYDGNGSQITSAYQSLTTTNTTFSVVFEVPVSGPSAKVLIRSLGGAAKWTIDKVQLHEVTPGIVSGTATDACDHWRKSGSVDVWREHNGSNTQDGSFYSMKVVGDTTVDFSIQSHNTTYAKEAVYSAFTGRTVTFGVWVKTDAASQVTAFIYDDAYTQSSSNTGTGWEWLEITKTADATGGFAVGVKVANTKTAYISQPMLVFGSSIGEGNFCQPPGEVVWLESWSGWGNTYDSTYSVADATVSTESEWDGKIPKGCKSRPR